MTDLEVMKRAKMYIEKLANGINPFDGTPIKDDSVVNDVRMARCFFYVADVLDKTISRSSQPMQPASDTKRKRIPFSITDEQLARIEISKAPIKISEFMKNINAVIDKNTMRNLPATKITDWLVYKEILEPVVINGHTHKMPTEAAELIGITSRLRRGREGEYYVNLYSEKAQRFLLDNIYEILICDIK